MKVDTKEMCEPGGREQGLSLVVLYCRDLQRSRAFYSALGLVLRSEQHGAGPEHFSIRLGGTVLELYPAGSRKVAPIRLGFANPIDRAALEVLDSCGGNVVIESLDVQGQRRMVIVDPDQNQIEICVN